MARSDPQLNIRIPEALKAALDSVAKDNGRSTTAEIIARLQASFEATPQMPPVIREEMEAMVNSLRTEREMLIEAMRAMLLEPDKINSKKVGTVKVRKRGAGVMTAVVTESKKSSK